MSKLSKRQRWVYTLLAIPIVNAFIIFLLKIDRGVVAENIEIILSSLVAILVAVIGHLSSWWQTDTNRVLELRVLQQELIRVNDKMSELEEDIDSIDRYNARISHKVTEGESNHKILLWGLAKANTRIDKVYDYISAGKE